MIPIFLWLVLSIHVGHADETDCRSYLQSGDQSRPHVWTWPTAMFDRQHVLEVDGRTHHLKFVAISAWGGGPEAKHLYRMVLRVRDDAEGARISSAVSGWMDGESPIKSVRTRIYGINKSQELPRSEGLMEMAIDFPADAASEAGRFFRALQTHGRLRVARQSSPADQKFDFSTNEGRRDWGYLTFLAWSRALSWDQVRALQDLGSSDFERIHAYLRGTREVWIKEERERNHVMHIDAAIAAGAVDRQIEVYRAIAGDQVDRAFALGQAGRTEVTLTDPAYQFTSLDPEFAAHWNRLKLRGRGVMLRITVPKHTPAAFIDAERIFPDRGHLELVLARGSTFRIESATVGPDGIRVLKVTLKSP